MPLFLQRVKGKVFTLKKMKFVQWGDKHLALSATEKGYGKKVKVEDFRLAHRGGVGVRTIPTDARNGLVIGLSTVTAESDILLIDQVGKIIRLPGSEVRTMGRQAKGVR